MNQVNAETGSRGGAEAKKTPSVLIRRLAFVPKAEPRKNLAFTVIVDHGNQPTPEDPAQKAAVFLTDLFNVSLANNVNLTEPYGREENVYAPKTNPDGTYYTRAQILEGYVATLTGKTGARMLTEVAGGISPTSPPTDHFLYLQYILAQIGKDDFTAKLSGKRGSLEGGGIEVAQVLDAFRKISEAPNSREKQKPTNPLSTVQPQPDTPQSGVNTNSSRVDFYRSEGVPEEVISGPPLGLDHRVRQWRSEQEYRKQGVPDQVISGPPVGLDHRVRQWNKEQAYRRQGVPDQVISGPPVGLDERVRQWQRNQSKRS